MCVQTWIWAEKEQERHRMAKRVELLVLDLHTSPPFCYSSVQNGGLSTLDYSAFSSCDKNEVIFGCTPALPSELLLLHNHRGKGLVRLDRFMCSCRMCGIWRHWLQLLRDTWVHWKDRSSAPLRTPNDSRSLPSAFFEHVTSELVEDSCQERSLRSTIPTQMMQGVNELSGSY